MRTPRHPTGPNPVPGVVPLSPVLNPGEWWRLTAAVRITDVGPLPRDLVAFHLPETRTPYLFPAGRALWQRADTPPADEVLRSRLHQWERAAGNAPRGTVEEDVARAVVSELVAIYEATTRGTFAPFPVPENGTTP